MKHESHPEIIARLRRVEGHVKSLIAMMQDGRSCIDLAQQMHAVEKAVGSAKRELIHDHIEHCFADGSEGDARASLAEIKQLAKYL